MSEQQLPKALARAVEVGRVKYAVVRAIVVAVVGVFAYRAGASACDAGIVAAVLVAAAAFAGWRSRAGLYGALVGAAVAAVPLAVGPLMTGHCTCAGGLCFSWCGVGCACASAAVGVVGGLAFSRQRAHRFDFAAAAVVCAALGVLLCPVSGVGSVVGAAVGLVVGFGPVAVFAAPRKALA